MYSGYAFEVSSVIVVAFVGVLWLSSKRKSKVRRNEVEDQ